MLILIIGTILLSLLMLLVLYQRIPNKRVFYGFCATLLLSISLVTYSIALEEEKPPAPREAVISHITAQQHIFAGWYTDYKKILESMDYNWQQYQLIMLSFQEGSINIHSTYNRLIMLEHEASQLVNTLDKLSPPISLDDGNYNLTLQLLRKTRQYSQRQLSAIKASREAADMAALTLNSQEEQNQLLQKAMLKYAPDALFTAEETLSLRNNLTLTEDF